MIKDLTDIAAPSEAELERTLSSLRQDSEVAHVLLGLSAALAQVQSVEETLQLAVTMVPELLGADRGFAAGLDSISGRFRIDALAGFDSELEKLMYELAEGANLPLLQAALTGGEPILIPDATADERISADDAARRRLGAYVGLPLTRWGEDFGGLGVEFESPRRFGPKDIALARGIARQVGVALANARQFNLLQSLRSFGLRVGSKLRLAAVIEEIAQGAKDLLAGDAAAVYFLDSSDRSLVAAAGHQSSFPLPESLARIDLATSPWDELAQHKTVSTMIAPVGSPMPTTAAVAAPIPGSGGTLLGAVAVLYKRSVTFRPEDAEALNVLAAQAAMAIENAHRFERQRRMARSLQEGLLSTEMPEIAGCAFGAVYEAAGGEADIGGDFFDVFDLPEGKFAMVVGDVSGKGAEAAAQTAMAKYMLRAFAIRNSTPSSVLFHLNNAMERDLAEDRFATLVYGVIDPEERAISISRGGHPAPLVYRKATQTVDVFETPGGLIGAFPDQQFEQATTKIEDGDVLLAFTDGLVEARRGDELFERERVIESLIKHASQGVPPSAIAQKVYDDAKEFGTVTDDTVVFAIGCGFPAPAS
ncbi:MAG TPA: SpoIIE family protein phosphatase [Actinomycetota bacterium]|jgi:GAF domain-containing protein